MNATDESQSIVNLLVNHRQIDETEEFAEMAIKSLVRKLKGKNDELCSLMIAITDNGATPTDCVTLKRTKCRQIELARKCYFPHVIYCKIWRWNDILKPKDLTHIKCCKFAFELNYDLVCINPYHYERVVYPDCTTDSMDIDSSDLGKIQEESSSTLSFPSGMFFFVLKLFFICGQWRSVTILRVIYHYKFVIVNKTQYHSTQPVLITKSFKRTLNLFSHLSPTERSSVADLTMRLLF